MRFLRFVLLFSMLLTIGPGNSSRAEAQVSCRSVFAPEITRQSQAQIASWKDIEAKLLKDWENPYSLIFDVKVEAQKLGQNPTVKAQELFKILQENSPGESLASKLDNWTQTESQALLVAEILIATGLKNHSQTLEHLYTHNVFFSDAHPIRGPPQSHRQGLVTFAFEKEGINPKIASLYRDPKFTEDQWSQMTDQQRIHALQSMTLEKKNFFQPMSWPPQKTNPQALAAFLLS